jgi:hypothetical protein
MAGVICALCSVFVPVRARWVFVSVRARWVARVQDGLNLSCCGAGMM